MINRRKNKDFRQVYGYSQKNVFFCMLIPMDMMRTCILFLLLLPAFIKSFAGIGIELDIAFSDTTFRCQYLYVLSPNSSGANDTLVVFDSLSFNKYNRVSLFYTVAEDRENMILAVDADGQERRSRLFKISPNRTTFAVSIKPQHINVSVKDFLYPLKYGNEESYLFFLLIFFVIKIFTTAIYIFVSRMPFRLILIAAGAYLLTSFIDWMFPVEYLFRFILVMVAEYLLIAFFGRKSISWLRAALLVLVVNAVCFGIIAIAYILFVFWG